MLLKSKDVFELGFTKPALVEALRFIRLSTAQTIHNSILHSVLR